MKYELNFDGIGYVNNRGIKSKYWGVSTRINSNGKDTWIVSYCPSDSDRTHSLSAEFSDFSEVDAARVASYVYKRQRAQMKLDKNDLILSADGKSVFRVLRNLNCIIREPIFS